MDISYHILEEITKGFSDDHKIGVGGYGKVYKGNYNGTDIAVKLLINEMTALDDKKFMNEFSNLLKSLEHPNIVKLVGYCYEIKKKYVEYNGEMHFCKYIHRLLCFEYLHGGSLDKHLYEECDGHDWHTRYNIIKGISDGLNFLHGNKILHLDLKPANILLDKCMVPKIADFGLSRIFGGTHTHETKECIGTISYMPPEFLAKRLISEKNDVYSLGVTMIQIIAGPKGYDKFGESQTEFRQSVLTNWRKRLEATPADPSEQLYQVQMCVKIAIHCVDCDRNNRPTIAVIVDILNKKETVDILKKKENVDSPKNKETGDTLDKKVTVDIDDKKETEIPMSQINRGLKSKLLSVHTGQLRFPIEPNKLTTTVSCPLHLKNNTAYRVAFRLLPKEPKKYVMSGALFGFVPPKSSYTIAVTMCEQLQLSSDNGDQSFTLETTMVDYKLLLPEAVISPGHLFAAAPSKGREVYQIKLTACSVRSEPEVMIISHKSLAYCMVDMHPTEPLIMTTQYSHGIRIWNYRTQEVKSVETSGFQVTSAKFLAVRDQQRIVVGAFDGTISVYSCDPAREICTRREHSAPVNSLAIHATKRYVLSASADGTINMWNYEMGLTLVRTFHPKGGAVLHVAFNPMDAHTFASASYNSTVKIWDSNSGECKLKLSGNWVGYFSRGDKLYLITYSKDTTAKIWECQTGHCVQTSKGHKEEDFVTACSHPDLPILITGSNKGLIHLWNSTSLRFNSTMNFGLGKVQALACLKGSRRIVIGYEKGLALTEISSEELGARMGSR